MFDLARAMADNPQVQRRKRGVILSPSGWQRLQAAEQQAADRYNAGKAYTLEQLGERTGLSPNTITKVRRRRLAVDRQTLEFYFNALSLSLNPDDYISIDSEKPIQSLQKPLRGQVPLDSNLYVERPPLESIAYEEILQPGALIRIKAPRQFGKTSLMSRMLKVAQDRGLRTTVLNFQLADALVFQNLDRFLRWFCAVITRDLRLPNRIEEHWDEVFGSNYNCTDYFENYLLPQLSSPLVLALDEVDAVYQYPAIAADFFGMLRAWYEKSRYGSSDSQIWQQFRLLVIHSTEAYLPLNLTQSPFNVGLLLELPTFTLEQVQDLATRYHLEPDGVALPLFELLGGIPYLTQMALHYLTSHDGTLYQLIQTSIAADSPFSPHLRRRLSHLQEHSGLLSTYAQIVQSETPIDVNLLQAFRLQSLGLVKLVNLQAAPACQLYRSYFGRVLPVLSETPETGRLK
ncbi:MAG: AAA-like domain-containing protein [Elainella sp. Prado103]|jgi:transcriptional regulator with XRE-family HTH domain|nr:AAA-like domain-containing protein [Elainella sp. Prado103]